MRAETSSAPFTAVSLVPGADRCYANTRQMNEWLPQRENEEKGSRSGKLQDFGDHILSFGSHSKGNEKIRNSLSKGLI